MKAIAIYAACITLMFWSCTKEKTDAVLNAQSGNNATAITGKVIFPAGYQLYALDAATGSKLWQYNLYNNILTGTGCIGNNIIYTVSAYPETSLFANDAATGALIWKDSLPHRGYTITSSPAIYKNTVYVNINFYLYAINGTDGTIYWRKNFDTIDNDDKAIASSPTVVKGSVYCGGTSGMFCIDARSGNLKWKYATSVRVRSSPCVVNGAVYFTADNGDSYALDTTGNLIWKVTAESNARSASSPTFHDGLVYNTIHVAPSTTILRALNASNGNIVWQQSRTINNLVVALTDYSDPSYADGVIYSRNVSTLYANDAVSGLQNWSSGLTYSPSDPKEQFRSLCATPKGVFTTDTSTWLYNFKASDGNEKWQALASGDISPFVVLDNGDVYYPSVSGMQQ
jgi:outer membrane protein assembly factor BamB